MRKRDVGKGSVPRPLTIPKEQFEKNWDEIFKKKEKPVPPSVPTK